MITRLLAAAALVLFPTALFSADEFKTATPAELAMKDVAIAPGASAVILDWSQRQDDKDHLWSEYMRIKVLKDEGRKYGDVAITHIPGLNSVGRIKARVTKPDGTVVPFSGNIYDKVVVKAGGVRVMTKTFTLPDVQAGAILEYRYERGSRPDFVSDTFFDIQRELPVLHETLWLRPLPRGNFSVFFLFNGLPEGKKPLRVGDHFELELENVAAFEEEPFSPPKTWTKPIVIFYYAKGNVPDAEAFWKEWARSHGEAVERFLSDAPAIREAAQQAIAGANTPEEKLRKLYARAQQVRNRSFEPAKTAQEERELPDNKSSLDVLTNGFGWRSEINRVFVSLARSAGFEANVVRIGDRTEWFLSKKLPLAAQMNNEVALVKVDGKEMLLDPGTPVAPFGMLSWEKTDVSGIKLTRKSDVPVWIVIPQDPPDSAWLRRVAKLHIDGGTLKGSIVITFLGHQAMSVRYAQRNHDDATAKKNVEELVKGWFFNGSSVKLTKLTGLRDVEAPLVAELDVELPSTGAVTTSRAIVPLAVFSAAAKSPLSSERRNADLYFHHQYRVDDDVTLDVPQGYDIEALPAGKKSDVVGLLFNTKYERTPNAVHLTRSLAVKTISIDVSQYDVARNFFKAVAAADQEQVVLKKTAK